MTTHVSQAGVPLRLRSLTYLEDGDTVVVGHLATDSYGVFPPDGAALLRRLEAGTPPQEAAGWYARTYGETVDLDDFLGVLDELGFIEDPGESDGAGPGAGAGASGPGAGGPGGSGAGGVRETGGVRWRRLGRWLFSPAGWVCFALLAGAAVLAMLAEPRLAPRPANLFFTDHISVVEVTLYLGQLPFLMVHEGFHALAGRRLGLPSRLRISHRLHFLVFETSLDGLVVRPRRERYLPILAGMLADLLVVAALTLAAWATLRPDGDVPLAGRLCLALAFSTVLRFVWQCYFYLRTDLYCVVVTVLGCQDLQRAARRILANRLRRLVRRPTLDETGLHPRDRVVGRWYSWLLLVGVGFAVGTTVVVGVPVAIRVLGTVFGRFTGGGRPWHEIADSVVFLVLNLAQFAMVGYLAVRARRGRGPAPTHLTT